MSPIIPLVSFLALVIAQLFAVQRAMSQPAVDIGGLLWFVMFIFAIVTIVTGFKAQSDHTSSEKNRKAAFAVSIISIVEVIAVIIYSFTVGYSGSPLGSFMLFNGLESLLSGIGNLMG